MPAQPVVGPPAALTPKPQQMVGQGWREHVKAPARRERGSHVGWGPQLLGASQGGEGAAERLAHDLRDVVQPSGLYNA